MHAIIYIVALLHYFHAGTPRLKDLINEVTPRYCAYWNEIGTLLDIHKGTLDSIESEYRDQRRCCNKMFEEWLDRDISASWEKLLSAITSPAVTVFLVENDRAGLYKLSLILRSLRYVCHVD